MKNWRKENRIKMTVTYTLDKYREGEENAVEEVTGYWAYINNPTLGTFVNVEVENEWISISRDLVQKIVFHGMPKWNLVTQDQVVNSAKVRKLNLDNELEVQMNTFDHEKRAKETRDKDVE